MDWSLLGCGAGGHVTFAPDEPGLRERLGTTTTARGGETWRCLRCGAFVLGPPTATGPAAGAPVVRRGKELRSALILRVFAIERFLRVIVFGVVAFALWRFSVSQLNIEAAYDRELPPIRTLLGNLGYNVDHSKLFGLINRAFTVDPSTLRWLALAAVGYTVIELIEGVGLWLLKRWGEYFAVVATGVGLPYEIWDLTSKVTALRVVAFGINLALVVYLVLSKRLLGARGGKEAYEASKRSQSILEAEIGALAAEEALAAEAAEAAEAEQKAKRAAAQGAGTGQDAGTGQAAETGQAPDADAAAEASPPPATRS